MATDATDRIGDRLDRPENVPQELAHLIPDDRQRVRRILSFPVSGRVLDVGCSDGSITKRIADRWRVSALGVDVRKPLPEDSNQHYGRGQVWSIRFEEWDIREPAGPLGSFNAAYACEVFEHLTDADAKKALRNICAVLRPGGDLIVTVPNRTPNDLYEVGMRSRWAWPDHRSRYTLASLIEFLKAGGFPIRGMEIVPLYDGERPEESIWLIVRARR